MNRTLRRLNPHLSPDDVRALTPSERDEQRYLFEWRDRWQDKHRDLRGLYANDNEMHGQHAVTPGVTPGIPDTFLACARQGFHGLYVEMKRTTGGRVSPAQDYFCHYLKGQGYEVAICKGAREAIATIVEYLGLPEDLINQ